MDSYPQFTEFPHILPVSRTASQPNDAVDPSLSIDHPLAVQAAHFQYLTSPFDQTKTHYALTATQSWWKGESPSINMSYIAPQFPVSADRFEPWNSEISTISDPQCPSSSNGGSLPSMTCIASPRHYHDELPMTTIDEPTGYPAPHALVDIDHTPLLSQPGVFEVLPDHRSSFETDLDPWSGSQSDRNGTPEQQWPSPLPAEAMPFPQPQRRTKTRPALKSRVRKSAEPRTSSTTVRNGRRRRVTATSDGENGTPRIFTCSFAPYGCQSTFVSKNEWKRHVTSQHLQLGFYRCDVGKCSINSQSATSNQNQYLTPSTSPRSRTRSSTSWSMPIRRRSRRRTRGVRRSTPTRARSASPTSSPSAGPRARASIPSTPNTAVC